MIDQSERLTHLWQKEFCFTLFFFSFLLLIRSSALLKIVCRHYFLSRMHIFPTVPRIFSMIACHLQWKIAQRNRYEQTKQKRAATVMNVVT